MERRPESELTDIARRVVTNELYVAWTAEMLENSFRSILALASIPEEEAKQIGCVFDEYKNASPIACNGFPVFLSAQFIHIEDVPFFVAECRRLHAALET